MAARLSLHQDRAGGMVCIELLGREAEGWAHVDDPDADPTSIRAALFDEVERVAKGPIGGVDVSRRPSRPRVPMGYQDLFAAPPAGRAAARLAMGDANSPASCDGRRGEGDWAV